MLTQEQLKIRSQNRLYRLRLSAIAVVTISRTKIPFSAFLDRQDLVQARNQQDFPKDYNSYLRIAKQRQPKIYNGNYASTINSFSIGAKLDERR